MQFEIKKHVYIVLPTEAADKAYGRIRGVFDDEPTAQQYAHKHGAGSKSLLAVLVTSQLEGVKCQHELHAYAEDFEGRVDCKKCHQAFSVKRI